MPMRTNGGPGTFYHVMDRVTEDLSNVRIYIDDAIVFDTEHVSRASALCDFLNRL